MLGEERFRDRHDAGRRLAGELGEYAGRDDVLVLALPRGGVPVGAEVAQALGAPLDVFVVRKLGVPGQEELAMGAIASGGVRILNEEIVQSFGLTDDQVAAAAALEQHELERRESRYRAGRTDVEIAGHTVILVDDGMATGATMLAAAAAVRAQDPARLVIAVPVGPADTCAGMREVADEVVCALCPERLDAVGLWYDDFSQTSDDEVAEILARTNGMPGAAPSR